MARYKRLCGYDVHRSSTPPGAATMLSTNCWGVTPASLALSSIFWPCSSVGDGKCPDCGREGVDAEEEAYFFRASKYAGRVRDLLLNTDFLEPKSRVNEMVNNFID